MALDLSLRNIKVLTSLSEETHAYTATLFLDGKKVALCSNHGHGGPDMVHWLDRTAEKMVAAHFKALPPERHYGMDLQPDLEMWCCEKVTNYLVLKDVKRVTGKTVFGIGPDGKEYTYKKVPPASLDVPRQHAGELTVRQYIERRDGVTILNGKDDAEILALVRRIP